MKTGSFMMLVVLVCFAYCDTITIEPFAPDIPDKPSKPGHKFKGAKISFEDANGAITDILKAKLEDTGFQCLEKGQALEISSDNSLLDSSLDTSSSTHIFKVSFETSVNFKNFGTLPYEVNKVDMGQTTKVCLLFGHYTNYSSEDQATKEHHIYLNLLGDQVPVDRKDLLFLAVSNDEDDYFVALSREKSQSGPQLENPRQQIKVLRCDKKTEGESVDFVLNNQIFSLKPKGTFAIAFLNKADVTNSSPVVETKSPDFKCSGEDLTLENLAGGFII